MGADKELGGIMDKIYMLQWSDSNHRGKYAYINKADAEKMAEKGNVKVSRIKKIACDLLGVKARWSVIEIPVIPER